MLATQSVYTPEQDDQIDGFWRRVPQVAGENIQLNGRIRTSLVLDAFPCQPQLALRQDNSSSPNNFIAWSSDSDTVSHFFCRLMLWPLGHSKTSR